MSELPAEELAGICELLAQLLVSEVDDGRLATLRDAAVVEVFEKAAPGYADSLGGEWSPARFDDVAATFCALFVLPDGVPPRAGAWRADDGEFGAAVSTMAEGVIESWSLELPPVFAELAPDHAARLLLLAGHLLRQDAALGEEFVGRALRPWVVEFGAALRSKSEEPIYAAVGGLLVGVFTT